MSDVGDLAALEAMALEMLSRVQVSKRRMLLRKVARNLQAGQSRRIGAQRNPDGSRFAPRRRAKDETGHHPLRFLYPKGAEKPALVSMAAGAWERQGPRIVGFDSISGKQKSYLWEKVARFLPPDRKSAATGRLRRKGAIRARAMFRKIKLARYLKAGSSSDEAWAGFDGRAADIARIHQEGGRDKVGKHEVRYPRRVLLGPTEADRRSALETLVAHIDPVAHL